MKRRICVVLALMIALMLSICAIADEYETQDVTEETETISIGSVDEEVTEAGDSDLGVAIETEDDNEEQTEIGEKPVIEGEPEEEEPADEGSLPEGAGSPEGETEGVPSDELPTEEEPVEEESVEEEPAEEEPVEEEPIEEEFVEEEPAEEEPADEGSLPEGAGSPEGETEGVPSDELPAEEPVEVVAAEPVEELIEAEFPVANELTYNGEEQPLVSAQGAWLYSLDGENYSEDIPTAVDAGEYTVYFKADADAEPEILTVTVAKADVTVIPPVAAYAEEL